MPCSSECESDVTRDEVCIYKALAGYYFHLLPDSSISYEYFVTGEYTNAIHSPVCMYVISWEQGYLCQNLGAEPNLSVTGTKHHHISSRSHQASWLQKVSFKFLFQPVDSKSAS